MIAKGLRYALSAICLLVLLVFLAACSTEKTSQDTEKGIQEILMNNLSNDSYLEGEDFTIVQNYVRQNEENMVKGYHEFMDGYYLYINRETRALMLMNDDGMIKRITSHTIDCQKEVIDIYTITNGNTYYVDGSVIYECHLGKEKKLETTIEYPKIVEVIQEGVLITDSKLENNNLLLVTEDEVITISNSFSQLPTEKDGNAIYYIDEELNLYMYNLCTHSTTFLYNNVYDLFQSSGLNFKCMNGVYRINIHVDEDGLEKIRDINLQDTEKIVEKW